jgi:peptidoglycan endopeptidase LytE
MIQNIRYGGLLTGVKVRARDRTGETTFLPNPSTNLGGNKEEIELNSFFRTFFLLSAFLFFGVLFSMQVQAQDNEVKVQVNDDLVHFPDAKPFIDDNERTQVPLRTISEKLGYEVKWEMDGQKVIVTVIKDGKSIVLNTGDTKAVVNGEAVEFDSSPVLAEGRIYVPVRFITQAFDTLVQWDPNNYIAIVATDGKYHAPSWYQPTIKPIIVNAKKFIGVPYLWGGTAPSGGFDCSGFVGYILNMEDKTLPRTSNEIFKTSGRFVSELLPGDLVFFSNSNSQPINHIGIYMGNNQFISATTSKGVKIDQLFGSPYWGARYVGAKRV